MNRPSTALYEFGSFRLNPQERTLLEGDERVELPPRVFDTLLALVEDSGRLVEKDKLMQAVWPDTAVEESNLSQAVYLLRKILHDGENGVRYIETVPKRGYRFVASVHLLGTAEETDKSAQDGSLQPLLQPRIDAAASQTVHANGTAGRTSLRSRWGPGWLTLLAVIALLAVFAGTVGWNRLRSQTDGEPIRSLAVLPLQNLSNDPEQEYFADGMTDELITDLAQVRQLKVVSKTSIMQYKGVRRPLPQIGRELGVDAVVEGSVLRSGNRVRITAQLIRTTTDRHLWAKAYEGDLKDILSLQAQVAEAITDEVKLSLTPGERNRFRASRPPVDPEAYEAYLRGRYVWNRRNVEGFQQAIDDFQHAIEKDPNFALAYSGLADCYTLLALDTLGPGLMEKAKASAEKALALDDGLAEAHTSLAAVKIFLDWDWPGAEKEFKRALDLNPNYAPAHHWYGTLLLGALGRHEEALAELTRAQSLDPSSLIVNTDIGYEYYLARQYDAAFSQYQKVLAMDRTFVPAHHDLLSYYAQRKMYDEWLQELIAVRLLIEQPKQAQAAKDLYAKGGFPRVMMEMATSRGTLEAGTIASNRGSFCTAAEAYATLDAVRPAMAALEKCYANREPGLIYLKVDPVWDHLRPEPALQALEHSMGLE